MFYSFSVLVVGSSPVIPKILMKNCPESNNSNFLYKTMKTLEKSRVFTSSSLLNRNYGASDGT